ncbi:U3 snoRNP protein [Dispira simplex]|nr:U3 snoRNP protein [Dispira simplex]
MLTVQFSNLCGTVYTKGTLAFTPDGNRLATPVGNRVTLFDLVNNKTETLPIPSSCDISGVTISPNGNLLIAVNSQGMVYLVNLPRRVVITEFRAGKRCKLVAFSPDSRLFAVTVEHLVHIYRTPGLDREFSPILPHCQWANHRDGITSLSWTPDSQFLLTGSKDATGSIFQIPRKSDPKAILQRITMTGHHGALIGFYYSPENCEFYSIMRNSRVIARQVVRKSDEKPVSLTEFFKQKRDCKTSITHNVKLADSFGYALVSAYLPATQMLVVAFKQGILGLWQLPTMSQLQTLNVAKAPIDTVALNPTGEWIGLASAEIGQLVVWEWQSESYVLKQQGHSYDVNSLAYSPDGQYVVTGGDDAKVKVWNVSTGFCFVTFADHEAPVTAVAFTKNGQVVISASTDGTVRAYDLIRYRNFRTLVTPDPVQFTSVAVDASGDIICAGSSDPFEVYVWSMQTGKLLDVLSGHEGPISQVAFDPTGQVIASGSWDKTVRLWNFLDRSKDTEVLAHTSDVLNLCFRPDGEELAVSTLDGNLQFWNVQYTNQTGSIEGRRDMGTRMVYSEQVSMGNSVVAQAFTTLSYSPDGLMILAGGNCNFICLYNARTQTFMRKFQLTTNQKYDGVVSRDYRQEKNAGIPLALVDDTDDSDTEMRLPRNHLPGAQRGNLSKRTTPPRIRAKAVTFSPTGRAWAAVSSEGLIIYSLDDTWLFDPFDLDTTITPSNVQKVLTQHEYLKALVMAFRLNMPPLIAQVYEAVPPSEVPLLTHDFPKLYLDRMFTFIASHSDQNPHVEFHLMWVSHLMKHHLPYIKSNMTLLQPVLRNLQKSVVRMHRDLAKLCNDNTYTIRYMLSLGAAANTSPANPAKPVEEPVDREMMVDDA